MNLATDFTNFISADSIFLVSDQFIVIFSNCNSIQALPPLCTISSHVLFNVFCFMDLLSAPRIIWNPSCLMLKSCCTIAMGFIYALWYLTRPGR
jgi:hypothetical protein